MSASPGPSSQPAASSGPANRHLLTPVERQRAQLDKLLKDPTKPAYVPPAPKEKTIRPPREMMKNVQGSSAGAGSGEFHVYKASRRREYERLKILDEKSQQEADDLAFETKKREWEDQADAKTAKNREKRRKKKERAKVKGNEKDVEGTSLERGPRATSGDVPLKKRRLVNGQELTFKRPGMDSDDEGDGEQGVGPAAPQTFSGPLREADVPAVPVSEEARITIHED